MKKAFLFLKNNYYAQKMLPFGAVLFAGFALLLPVSCICFKAGGFLSISFFLSLLWCLSVFVAPFCFVLSLFVAMPPLKRRGKFDKISSYICFGGWCYAVYRVVLTVSAVLINQRSLVYRQDESLFQALNQPLVCLVGVLMAVCLAVVFRSKLFPRAQVPFVKYRGAWVLGFFLSGFSFYLLIFKYESILEKAKQLMQ